MRSQQQQQTVGCQKYTLITKGHQRSNYLVSSWSLRKSKPYDDSICSREQSGLHELEASWLLSMAALSSSLFCYLHLLWAKVSDLHLEECSEPKPPALRLCQVRAAKELLPSSPFDVWEGGHLMERDLGSCNVTHSDLELLRS